MAINVMAHSWNPSRANRPNSRPSCCVQPSGIAFAASNARMQAARFLAILCCASLALPPGWCQLPYCTSAAQALAAARPPACSHCLPNQRQKSSPGGCDRQNADCCCGHWQAVQPQTVTPEDAAGGAFGRVLADAHLCDFGRSGRSDLGCAILAGPPLRVLLCVWLC